MTKGGKNPAPIGIASAFRWQSRYGAGFAPGFTIVEVLIVLAVTGLLLISGLALVNGRQDRTAFMTAVHGLQQEMEQIVNETASGYYPNGANFSCNAAGMAQPTITTLTTSAQGTNSGCVFLGKVLEFGESSNPDELIAIPVAGNRNGSQLKGSGISGGAQPIAIAPTGMPHVPDLTESHAISAGLVASAMYYNGSLSNETAGVGFMAGDSDGVYLADDGTGQGTLKSGVQQLSLYAIQGTSVGTTTLQNMAGKINAANGANFTNVKSVTVCMVSGATKQHANLTIGDLNNQTAVSLQVLSGTTC